MNCFQIILEAAQEIEAGIPSTTSIPSLAEFIRWLNKAQDIVAERTNCLERLQTLSTVANQTEYALDSRTIRPKSIEWVKSTSNIFRPSYENIKTFRAVYASKRTGDCEIWSLWNKKLWIYPPVSSGAGTAVLSGNHTATVTTLTFVSTANFPARGSIIIESEVIYYTGSTSTTLTGCTRGAEGTVSASHADTTVATERDINCWNYVRYLDREYDIYKTGTAVFTNASKTVTGTSTYFSTNVYKNWEIGTGANPDKWYTVDTLTSATGLELTAVYGEATVNPTAVYIASPILDIPKEYTDLLKDYMCFRGKLRKENYAGASAYKQEFERGLILAKIGIENKQMQSYETIDFGEYGEE